MALNKWTEEELGYLRQFYPFISAKELSELFDGRHTPKSLKDKAWNMRIFKSPERLREMGASNVAVRWNRVRAAQRGGQGTQPCF